MTEFTKHTAGDPCWVDLMSPDVDASKAFYSSVFGWESDDQFDDEGNRIYVMFRQDGKAVAGLGGQPPEMAGSPAIWNTYIATDDVAATAEKVTANGGTVLMPPMQVMESGTMAVFMAPDGAGFSAWQAGDHIGAEVGNVANTYGWSELSSRDLDNALHFYSAVFGWEYQTGAEMPDYTLISGGTNDEGRGGAMAMPEEVPAEIPSYWGTYFTVDDAAATAAAAEAAGGATVMEPMAIPGVGTMVVLSDPTGGMFSAMQSEN